VKTSQLNKITLMQFIFLIYGVQVGVGVLQLPRTLAESAGNDGWMAIPISWFFSTIVGLLVIQVMKKNPDKPLPALLTYYFGKWAGTMLTILFALFYAFTAGSVIIRQILFVKAWILPETPDYLLVVLFAIPGYLIVRGSVSVLGRYAELVFFLTLWMTLFYLIPLKDAHWLHLLPLFKGKWSSLLLASKTTLYSYFGSEMAMIWYPMLQQKQYASIGVIIANSLTMVSYLIVTLVCFVFFSPDEITQYNEPTISVLKIIEFKIVERLELVFLAFYLFVISKTWMIFAWSTVFCTSQLLGHKDHKIHLLLFLIFIAMYTFLFSISFAQNDEWQKWIGNISLYLSYTFPVCLWFYGIIRRRIRRRCAP
jgi:spore germination protein (amino acid permease)